MNRKTLLKDLTEEVEKVCPGEGEDDLDGDDLESIEEAVEKVLEGARECLDEEDGDEEELPLAGDAVNEDAEEASEK